MELLRPTRLSRQPNDGWQCRRRERILVPPERVWSALTTAEELRKWWCDETDVDLRVGGRFAFRGASSFAPSEDAEIIELAAPHLLAYRWRIDEVETTVRIELESQLEQTDLVVTQSAQRSPAWDGAADGPNWWWPALATLRSHIDDGRPILRLDYERLQKVDELSFKVGVTTFPWVVWTKLTTARELRRWWASSPTIELEEGGVFCFDDSRLGPRNVAGIEEGIRLGLDWQWTIDETSHIEWRIEETDDETVVSVVDASPPPEGMERTRRAIYLASMTLYLAQMSAQGVSPMEYQDPWSRPSGPGFP